MSLPVGRLQAFMLLLIGLPLLSCGGGGGGEAAGGSHSATPAVITVSGSVQAPNNGTVVFHRKPTLGDFIVAEAYAALTGLATVPDNTLVELVRLNGTGSAATVLATTTTSGGHYGFNLTALGVQPAHNMIVRVTGSGGKQMRAFVVGTAADINPVSEAAYQLAIESLNGAPLANLTFQEVSDITGAIQLMALNGNVGNAVSVDQAVGLVRTAVAGNPDITEYLALAGASGETTQGPGDIGNYFPFTHGSIWRYHGRRGSGSLSGYDTTVVVSGQETSPLSGVLSTVLSETNPQGSLTPQKSYAVKARTGVTDHGNDDPTDSLTRTLAPYHSVHFPLTLGSTTVLIQQSGLDWGTDEDGDGRRETFSITATQNVRGLENVTVPIQAFTNSLRIDFTVVIVVFFTTGGSATLTQVDSVWHVPGVGRVKEIVETQVDDGPVLVPLTEELLGYVINGQGSGLRIEVTPSSVSLGEGKTIQLRATAFDGGNNVVSGIPFAWLSDNPAVATISQTGLVTAGVMGTTNISVSGGSNLVPVTVSNIRILPLATNDLTFDPLSQRLYASQPGTPGSVTVIDPVTGTIGPSTPVGNGPNKLALSDDGQVLYVGLDADSAVRVVALPTLTAGVQFSLGPPPPVFPTDSICAQDMKVLPGTRTSVAVARIRHVGTCHVGGPVDVKVYDDGVPRPNSYGNQIGVLAFGDTSTVLYGYDRFDSGEYFDRMSVTPSGLSLIDSAHRLVGFNREMIYAAGRLYFTNGRILDPVTVRIVGMIDSSGWTVRPDPALGKVYFLTSVDDGTVQLNVFDLTTSQGIGSLNISGLRTFPIPPNFLPRVTRLIRWGADGLAFRSSTGEVVLLRSPLVQPTSP